MNTIVERFLIPLFVIMSFLYAFNSLGHERVELKKAFYHQAHNGGMYLEKGNLVLYFSHHPHIKEVTSPHDHTTQARSFFFPNAVALTSECVSMIERINALRDGYSVKIEHVTIPDKGLMITFMIPEDKIALQYDLFDSIGLQKGIIFHLYDKGVMGQLQDNHNKPLLRTLWHTGKPRVVIDPGHGGYDSGAIGCHGIKEKDICLALGKDVADLLEKQGCSVLLTRTRDSDVFLDSRTLLANNNQADMMVSIHANYSHNNRARGIETFCLKPSLLSSQYSDLSGAEKSYAERSLRDLCDRSYHVAQSVHKHVLKAASALDSKTVDRKVKFSVAQVLIGSQMPSILIEVGFVSHEKEAALLQSASYRNSLAQGIASGIMAVFSA